MDAVQGECEFVLDREVTIREVAEVREALEQALGRADHLTLRFGDIGESDLTLVQLIESARKSAARDQRRLTLAEPATGALHALLERGGFLAAASPEHRRFWLQEETQ